MELQGRPLQNRVDPNGKIISTPARGTLMGNRGILHNDKKVIVKKAAHKSWITCDPNFEGIKRELMKPGTYTELFFLDEAVAYSSGHRPCSECRRATYKTFKTCWIESNGKHYDMASTNVPEIDGVLHRERIDKQGDKVTFTEEVSNLPDGTFIEHEGKNYLAWQSRYLEWSATGYVSAIKLPQNLRVTVLTPRSIVRMFSNGLVPSVHSSVLTL